MKIENVTNLYLVTHTHHHGVSTYFIKAATEPDEDQIVADLDIDFEPDRDEYLDIEPVTCLYNYEED
jgi:hypothetical protein